MRPENRAGDDRTRALPGLLSPEADKYEPVKFAAAEACFEITEQLRLMVDGEVAERRVERSPDEWTSALKDLMRFLGAIDVGVAPLRPYHVYTHVGRGTGTWGEPVELDHRWAVAFTVEMDHDAVAYAPDAPTVAESARQYVALSRIGVEVASAVRRWGYPARAHTDGNYRVIAPLVARDAGLGEIGRMGILMTLRLGPRVRTGVVTTDLPLIADPPGDDLSVLDFCSTCRKCADNCPVGAIPTGDRESIDEDGLRWRIDPDSCYRYWAAAGTDCAVCMRVCPYSHPDSAAHNVVRWAIRRSGGARRMMLRADDLFYGRRPAPRSFQ
jgi:reductive dehalogenase